MKIICDSRKLADAFLLAGSVAPSRSPKEILRNVHIVARGGKAILTATDTEVGIRVTVDDGIEVVSEGAVLLPKDRVSAILRENTEESVTVDSDGSQTVISAGRSKYKLPTENPDEFPAVSAGIGDGFIEVPARMLSTMIKRTAFATDMESSRYALGGINLETDGDTLIAVGTDGRRLTKFSGPVVRHGDHSIGTGKAVVPTRAATLIERAIGFRPEDVAKVAVTMNDIVIESESCVIYSRLVEGRYPNWRQVIPNRESPSTVDVVAGVLHTAMRQAAIACDRESRGINMTFSEQGIRLEASTVDVGESSVDVFATGDFASEGNIQLRVDNTFVADFLKVIDSESPVVADIESESTPLVLRTDDGYVCVIMPMSKDV